MAARQRAPARFWPAAEVSGRERDRSLLVVCVESRINPPAQANSDTNTNNHQTASQNMVDIGTWRTTRVPRSPVGAKNVRSPPGDHRTPVPCKIHKNITNPFFGPPPTRSHRRPCRGASSSASKARFHLHLPGFLLVGPLGYRPAMFPRSGPFPFPSVALGWWRVSLDHPASMDTVSVVLGRSRVEEH